MLEDMVDADNPGAGSRLTLSQDVEGPASGTALIISGTASGLEWSDVPLSARLRLASIFSCIFLR